MANTGYELSIYGSNEGTDEGGPDFNNIIIIFCFWTILKFGYVSLYVWFLLGFSHLYSMLIH